MKTFATLLGSLLVIGSLALATTADAQACPAGRSCFYVPPAMPAPPGFVVDWDMVLASPRGTITGTWRAGAGAPNAFTVSPGAPLVVPLSALEGTALTYGLAETSGIFIDASSQELLVDHRLIVGPWQSSSTIKSSAFSLGTRFRLAGYDLNSQGSPDTGFDYASVYAPFGGTVTFTAPPGATLPFWEADITSLTLAVTLTPGQTYLARTLPQSICTREIDAALVTSTDPIAVDTGGRGWSELCGVSGGCGDDGADNVLPVSGLGSQFVLLDYPSTAANGERAVVIADTDGTGVLVNGVLVGTLSAGGTQVITLSGTTYVETSNPAYVFETTGLSGCETDIALIPSIALAPVGAWVVDLDVPAGFTAEIGVVLATGTLPSLRVDGAVPVLLTSGTVPGRPDLTAVQIMIAAGDHSISAGADFQLGLVTSAGGTGLFGYYTPFRIPGCGDGTRSATEACDDGNLTDGDGCSSSCKIEISFTGCATTTDCVPAGRCDAGTCVARCSTNAECNDSNACTTDSCDATGACSNVALAAGAAGSCAAGLVCTGAPANRCVQCVDDTQCAAPTAHCEMTTNVCIACTTDAECDDMNACTTDVCASSSCSSTPVANGTSCASGRCMAGSCSVQCGDGIVAQGIEGCDDGNTISMDGCSAVCAVEAGWSCGCGSPVISYSMEMLAGRVGGDGGGPGPQQGCTGADVLIGLAIDWSNGRGEGVRTTTICGSVSVAAGGAVTTTQTTQDTQGGSGCGGWDPSTTSAGVTCPTGWAIVGIQGRQSNLSGTPTLFDDLSIVCEQLGPDGSAFGPTMTLNIAGGGAAGTPQSVSCPAAQIARFFRTRSGCGQDALDLFCGVASADCGGSPSICGTLCGDGVVGAPVETCDTTGQSSTCDADCTAVVCGDSTINVTADEQCDDGNTTAGDGCSPTCHVEGDGGMPDAGPPDAGPRDGGVDAGPRDAGLDAGPRDAGVDAGRDASLMADASAPDAGPTLVGVSGGACGCRAAGGGSGGSGATVLLTLALAVLATRRRARSGR